MALTFFIEGVLLRGTLNAQTIGLLGVVGWNLYLEGCAFSAPQFKHWQYVNKRLALEFITKLINIINCTQGSETCHLCLEIFLDKAVELLTLREIKADGRKCKLTKRCKQMHWK